MPVVFLGMGSLPVDGSVVRVIGTVGLTCLAAGLVVGAIHRLVMAALLRRKPAA